MQAVLSVPRLSTYLAACSGDSDTAVQLYLWNAAAASSLMLPMHFAEVSTRNVVADALESVYGTRWPWNHSFEFSLPSPQRGFNPRSELVSVRSRETTTGKVVAELKFVFWQKMFTQRFDARLWDGHILSLFPNSTATADSDLRARIYSDLEVIRKLRNRMAHHEPIFARNLSAELEQILDLIELRSVEVAAWVRANEKVSRSLQTKP
ncbi:hypothetical protein CVV68_16170 [Arthrobacter livingstonensis]|uniref:Abi-like protein n=2 Tax=Arthrobacter TaxID=1663 RepID=A0A2V5L3F8_9MICC|nr:hypothetical protein CVV68_16170 [Arthrobacter livingstonensis]